MKTAIFTLLALGLCAIPAAAQHHPAKHQDSTSLNSVITDSLDREKAFNAFNQNSPDAYHIPDAPRFLIMGKNNKFYLGIGGTAKATASYDFGATMNNPNMFVTADIPMNQAKGNGGLFQVSAQQTSLFVNLVALPDNPNQIGVYMSANFIGQNYGFELMYAYMKYRGFTVGYDYSLFSDMAAAPPTIDYEGPNALTSVPNGVIDYRHSFNKTFSLGIGAELPQASYTNSDGTYKVTQRVPDIPAYVQFAWGKGSSSWIRFSGILRNIAYRDVIADKTQNVVGWGVKASGSAQIAPGLTAYYQGVFGKGVASYIQDLNGDGLDLTPNPDQNGRLHPVKVWGAYGGLQYTFSPKVYASATYSHVRTYAERYNGGATPWSDQYKYAQYAVANVFYEITPILTWGIEYIWGRRVDMSGLSHHDNRIQTMLQVSF